MVKQGSGKGGNGNAHFRLVILEADVPGGEIGQIAQAVQNALRPSTPPVQRVINATPQLGSSAAAQGDLFDQADVSGTEDAEADSPALTPKAPREAKPRRLPTPKLLELSEQQVASWTEYAGAKHPKADVDRYRLAVAWFQDHGAEDGVTADHVFTCFKQMNWSTAIDDFGSPLRSLKASHHLKSTGRGIFTITQV